MHVTNTTQHPSPPKPKPAFPGFYALIPVVLLVLIGFVVALVVQIKKRSRLDELRHRLIPLYTYDPTEDEDWGDSFKDDEEEELVVPLCRDTTLSLTSAYGT